MEAIGYKSLSNVFGVAVYEVNDEMAVAAFVQMNKADAPRRAKKLVFMRTFGISLLV